MQPSGNQQILQLAAMLYGRDSERFLHELDRTVARWKDRLPARSGGAEFSERDLLFITYGDQFRPRDGSRKPLHALQEFAERRLRELCSYIHILPFFPSTSDDGFAVSDYRRVDPALGDWEPIRQTSASFRMAFDLVLNHSSVSHNWFQRFLAGDPGYEHYYHARPPEYDTSQVVRPRTHPLLTPFDRPNGEKVYVWTTFSEDQVDLNYSAPELMIEIIDTLLLYISQGASMIRLDAIAYLWKEDGSSCIHHPNTHNVVKLFRALVDHLQLDTVLLTETNVPHEENVSYFGNGSDEAHMVYNFALPPLTLQAFVSGSAEYLSSWAATLPEQSEGTTFLNFLASHDGVGVTPAAGILSEERFDHLIETVAARGGRVSWKSTPRGKVPYELNCNYFSAVADPELPQDLRVRAFLSAQAIMLALAGVPGVYVHSLLGSENWEEGPALLGHNRAINRKKMCLAEVDAELDKPRTVRHAVFTGFSRLITARRQTAAFAPSARQKVLSAGLGTGAGREAGAPAPREVFALLREAPAGRILCLTNCSAQELSWPLDPALAPAGRPLRDIITGTLVQPATAELCIRLEQYQTLWLELPS